MVNTRRRRYSPSPNSPPRTPPRTPRLSPRSNSSIIRSLFGTTPRSRTTASRSSRRSLSTISPLTEASFGSPGWSTPGTGTVSRALNEELDALVEEALHPPPVKQRKALPPTYRSYLANNGARLKKNRTQAAHKAARGCPYLEHVPGYYRCAKYQHARKKAQRAGIQLL